MQGKYGYYFMLSIFALIFYGLIKNIGGFEIWLAFFVIILGMCYLPLLNRGKLSKTELIK